jgi:hypothetical protein
MIFMFSNNQPSSRMDLERFCARLYVAVGGKSSGHGNGVETSRRDDPPSLSQTQWLRGMDEIHAAGPFEGLEPVHIEITIPIRNGFNMLQSSNPCR